MPKCQNVVEIKGYGPSGPGQIFFWQHLNDEVFKECPLFTVDTMKKVDVYLPPIRKYSAGLPELWRLSLSLSRSSSFMVVHSIFMRRCEQAYLSLLTLFTFKTQPTSR